MNKLNSGILNDDYVRIELRRIMVKYGLIGLILFFKIDIKAQNYYFGDLHVHTTLSDGKISPQDVYDYAKNVSKIDFICVTDHDIYPRELRWDSVQYFVRKNNKEHSFITFSGFEFTNFTSGHRTIIFPQGTGELFKASSTDIRDLSKLVNDKGGIVNIAHPNKIPYASSVTEINEVQETNIEILSSNRFEFYNNPQAPAMQQIGSSVQDWLAKGKMLGFLGVTDSHNGTPGLYGLTGVWASSLTSKNILNALKSRHTFVTNGKKIKAILSSGSHIMGDIIHFTDNYHRSFNYKIIGTSVLKKLEIIKNNIVVDSLFPGSKEISGNYADKDSSAYSYYYIRGEQDDGGMIWTSPIFFLKGYSGKELSLLCSPNPSDGHVKIEYFLPSNSSVIIQLFDYMGEQKKIIFNGFNFAGTHELDVNLNDLSKGLYILIIKAGSLKKNLRILIK